MFDFGTGGLDLAYEVMRGYDALVLIDVSRQGGEPGTLYVMEAAEERGRGRHRGRPGDQPARHGPADRAALRQDARRAGRARSWSSPASRPSVEEMGMGLSDEVERAVDGAVDLVLETIEELRSDAAYAVD